MCAASEAKSDDLAPASGRLCIDPCQRPLPRRAPPFLFQVPLPTTAACSGGYVPQPHRLSGSGAAGHRRGCAPPALERRARPAAAARGRDRALVSSGLGIGEGETRSSTKRNETVSMTYGWQRGMETLQKHLPVSVPEGLNELQKIAVRFEEKIYTAATDHSDYFRKISRKMLSMETETQQAPAIAQVISNQNNPDQASADYTTQTGHAGAGDWQEEIYQMIKSLKDQHFVELNKLFNKVSVKLQHVDSIIPRQMPSEQYERMKSFKIMLNRILQLLQISKSVIQPALRNKVPQYEKQIISIFNSQRRKPVQPHAPQRFQPPAGQASNSNISQQQQPSQSLQQHDNHTNPQASLSSMSTGLQSSSMVQTYSVRYVPAPPTANFGVPAQQNGADIQRQAGSNMEAAQGSNFNSWQYGSMSGALRQGSTGPMQGTMNVQLQTGSSSSMLSHLSGQRKHMTKRKWRDTL